MARIKKQNFIIDIGNQDLLNQKPNVYIHEQYNKKDLKRFSTASVDELELIFANDPALLLQQNEGLSAIHYAVLNPKINVLEFTINLYKKHNLNLNVPTQKDKETQVGVPYIEGETALDLAITFDSLEKFNLMVKAGINEVLTANGFHNFTTKPEHKYKHYIRDIRYAGNYQSAHDEKLLKNFVTQENHTIFTTLFLKKAYRIFNNLNMSDPTKQIFEKDVLDFSNKSLNKDADMISAEFFENKKVDDGSYHSIYDNLKTYHANKLNVLGNFDYQNYPNLAHCFLDHFNNYFDIHGGNYYDNNVLMLITNYLNTNKELIENNTMLNQKAIKVLNEYNPKIQKNYNFEKNNSYIEQLNNLKENFKLHASMSKDSGNTSNSSISKKMKI